jgi:3-dehydroquinate synthetase
MSEQQHRRGNLSVRGWVHGSAVVLGLVAIATLICVMYMTCQDHMTRSMEVSRNTQWRAHAPVEGAQAAAILQGVERVPGR